MRSELLRVQQEEMQKLHREFEIQLTSMKLQLQQAHELHSRDVSLANNQHFELFEYLVMNKFNRAA